MPASRPWCRHRSRHLATAVGCCCARPAPNHCCASWSKAWTAAPSGTAPVPSRMRSSRPPIWHDYGNTATGETEPMKRTPLIAGNWKMHGSRAAIDRFAGTLQAADLPGGVELLVCVPFVYLQRMRSVLSASTVAVGAQNLAGEVESGAFTGEVNGTMLADIGCSHVIVGHSERRALYGESDGVVARKVDAALSAGLRPILCIGETLEQRDAGETEAVLQRQLRAVLDDRDARTLAPLTIAYEPVWAIGTGHSASAEQAQQAHDFIREQIAAKDVT